MTALTVLPGGLEPMDTPFVLDERSRRPGMAHETVELAYHTLLAWSQAAAGSMLAWICAQLERMPRRRHLWEAAAAERGQTLAEWVAIRQAATGMRLPAWRPGS